MAYASDITKQFTTYDTRTAPFNTIREDLSDIITIMSPLDTPLQSMLPMTPVQSYVYTWPVDDIPTPTSAAAAIEGADATFSATGAGNDVRLRLGNGTFIATKYVDVTDSERVVNLAGVEDEFAYQVWKKTLEMAKQAEFNLHWGQYAAGNDTTPATGVARQTEGFYTYAWLAAQGAAAESIGGIASLDFSSSGRAEPYASTFYDPGSPANITRAILHDNLLAPAWKNGMQIEGAIMLCGSDIKFLVADFALASNGPRNERVIPAEAATVIDTIDIIRTDFGYLYVNLDRYFDGADSLTVTLTRATSPNSVAHVVNQSGLIFQPGMLEIGCLRPASFTLLAKIGDATKGMTVMECGAKPLNPVAMIAFTDLVAA